MGKVLWGELSCPCDRSYSYFSSNPYLQIYRNSYCPFLGVGGKTLKFLLSSLYVMGKALTGLVFQLIYYLIKKILETSSTDK